MGNINSYKRCTEPKMIKTIVLPTYSHDKINVYNDGYLSLQRFGNEICGGYKIDDIKNKYIVSRRPNRIKKAL
jgi:hypothetical protein